MRTGFKLLLMTVEPTADMYLKYLRCSIDTKAYIAAAIKF